MRVEWEGVPAGVREVVQQRLGEPVVAAVTRSGGFSPGLAAMLETRSGRRVFAKAVGPERNPDSPDIHRREARIVERLPVGLPVPRLLFDFEDAASGWVVLVFEQVDGRQPRLPWEAEELDRVMEALAELSAALTPSPVEAPELSERLAGSFSGWRRLAAARETRLEPWALRNLERLAALEESAAAAGAGETLLHLDVRADNLLLTPERVVLIDWPWAAVGAAFVDVVFFAPSVEMQGGPRCEELVARHPAGRTARKEDLDPVLSALAGFFVRLSLEAPPPNLPGLRAFQAAQGEIAVRWLAERTGWR